MVNRDRYNRSSASAQTNLNCLAWNRRQKALVSKGTGRKQTYAISSLNGYLLKLVEQFTYLGSNIASTESNGNIYIGKT